MLKNLSKLIAMGSLIGLTVACGQQASESKSQQGIKTSTLNLKNELRSEPVRNTATAQLSCEQVWSSYIAANPTGFSKTYQSTTTEEYTGSTGLPAPTTLVETSKETVASSTDAAITFTYEYSSTAAPTPVVESQTLSKVDFLASCQAPATEQPSEQPTGDQPTVEILAQSQTSLTVKAGTFDTDYVKGKITQTGANAFEAVAEEWYVTGSDFLVKSTFDSVSKYGEISVKTVQTVELIELVIPAAPAA